MNYNNRDIQTKYIIVTCLYRMCFWIVIYYKIAVLTKADIGSQGDLRSLFYQEVFTFLSIKYNSIAFVRPWFIHLGCFHFITIIQYYDTGLTELNNVNWNDNEDGAILFNIHTCCCISDRKKIPSDGEVRKKESFIDKSWCRNLHRRLKWLCFKAEVLPHT